MCGKKSERNFFIVIACDEKFYMMREREEMQAIIFKHKTVEKSHQYLCGYTVRLAKSGRKKEKLFT